MKRFLPLLLAAVLACGCSTLAKIDWDYGRLASAGVKAATAASISEISAPVCFAISSATIFAVP